MQVDGISIPLSIDMDGDEREDGYYYTEPVFLEKTDRISYVIETRKDIVLPNISLIGLDTDEHSLSIAFGSDTVEAETTGIDIVKRAGW